VLGAKFPHRTVVLANLKKDGQTGVKDFAEAFFRKTGIRLQVRDYDAPELVDTLFSHPHPYDMVMIWASVVQPEYDTFFEDILKKGGLVDYDMPKLDAIYRAMRKQDEEQTRTVMAVRIAEGLEDEHAVLPLYQEVEHFYYPAKIKNLSVGRGFTEYPEVADFRW
jgi:ABC-type transport system substrate-binding protein